MNFLVVCVIVSAFYVPVQDPMAESLEECSEYAELYFYDIEEDYSDSFFALYSDSQVERLTGETPQGDVIVRTELKDSEADSK